MNSANSTPKSREVFISYSSKDHKLAASISAYLESKGVSTFMASRDIVSGSAYAEALMDGINNCKTMVVVFTEKSNASLNVRNEIERAFNLKKSIILFRVDNIALSKSLEYFFATFHWLEAFENSPELYFEKLYASIRGLPMPPLPKSHFRNKKLARIILTAYCIASLAFLLGFVFPGVGDYQFINRKNSKGISFISAVRKAGLQDVEDVASNKNPPIEFYLQAEKEIFIAGTTMRRTFEEYKDELDSMMLRGVKLQVLFLNPNSTDTIISDKINRRNNNYAADFARVKSIIVNDDAFFKNPNVSFRFVPRIPSFTGVMIDGDVNNTAAPDDEGGRIRIVPYLWSLKHNDWIIQFSKQKDVASAYDDYAKEFRYLWTSVAEEPPEYFR